MTKIISEGEARADEITLTPFIPKNFSQKNGGTESFAVPATLTPQSAGGAVPVLSDHTENNPQIMVTPEAETGPKTVTAKANPLAVQFFFCLNDGEDRPDSFFLSEIQKRIAETPLSSGMVGIPFVSTFDFTIEGIEIWKDNFTDENQVGLHLQRQNNVFHLTGTPLKEFDGRLSFWYALRKKGEEFKGQSIITRKSFTINPNPRDLWQSRPVEDYEGYENRDTDARGEEIFAPGAPCKFEIIAASTRGRSHAHIAKPRDDYFQFLVNAETGWNFVAVADGAGSAKYSRKGSELACETVIQNLNTQLSAEFTQKCRKEWLDYYQNYREQFKQSDGKIPDDRKNEFMEKTQLGTVFHRAVYSAHEAIRAEAANRNGAKLNDYHTTLLCAAFRYFPELSSWFVASYWLGDGGAAILRWNNTDRVLVLGEPDGGEFAGQTKFLTMKSEIDAAPIHARSRFSFCDSFAAMLLVTDGIIDPFFPSEAAVGEEPRWLDFYEKKLRVDCEEEPRGCPEIFAADKSLSEKSNALLRWLNFWSKGNHDDRTVLIVRAKEA